MNRPTVAAFMVACSVFVCIIAATPKPTIPKLCGTDQWVRRTNSPTIKVYSSTDDSLEVHSLVVVSNREHIVHFTDRQSVEQVRTNILETIILDTNVVSYKMEPPPLPTRVPMPVRTR